MDLTSILSIAGMAIGTLTDIAKNDSANKASQEAAKARAKQLAAETATKEQTTKNLLKEQLAKRRAAFASSGLNPDEGSALALLGGIENDAEEDLKNLRSGYLYKLDDISNSAGEVQRKSLLSNVDYLTSGASGLAGRLAQN